jgi:hypothetical protein
MNLVILQNDKGGEETPISLEHFDPTVIGSFPLKVRNVQ